jgi:hypothetical protein
MENIIYIHKWVAIITCHFKKTHMFTHITKQIRHDKHTHTHTQACTHTQTACVHTHTHSAPAPQTHDICQYLYLIMIVSTIPDKSSIQHTDHTELNNFGWSNLHNDICTFTLWYLYIHTMISVHSHDICTFTLYLYIHTMISVHSHYDICTFTLWYPYIHTTISVHSHYDICTFTLWYLYIHTTISVHSHYDICTFTLRYLYIHTKLCGILFPAHPNSIQYLQKSGILKKHVNGS